MCKSTELVSERDWIEIQNWLGEKFILWPVLTLPHASTGSCATHRVQACVTCSQRKPLAWSRWCYLPELPGSGSTSGNHTVLEVECTVGCAQGMPSDLQSCAEGLGFPCGISQPSNTQPPSSLLQRHYRWWSALCF